MINFKDLLAACLSGITTQQNKEIDWVDNDGDNCTVEIINIEEQQYIIRYRYYDGMLYMLSLLQLSGNFKIYDLMK